MVAIGGTSRYTVSLCQMPPKFTVSPGSFATEMISGKPSIPFTNGYSTGVPIRRANARKSAGGNVWSRKNTTRCSSHAFRIAATVASLSSEERSTPKISAPSAPAMGRTSIAAASVVMA